jgi:site-specific recombinase
VLNLSVSFGLAFVVALRSRGVRLKERRRVVMAILRRVRRHPLSFLWPPKADGANPTG